MATPWGRDPAGNGERSNPLPCFFGRETELGMGTAERAIVFIDGNNLYHGLKERGWPSWIEIGSLAERLVGSQRKLQRTYYYNAPPPGGSPHEGVGRYYLEKIKGTPNIVFRKSRLQYATKVDENGTYDTFEEKGADTALVADMVECAILDQCDVLILVSSDGDFAPAAETVQRFDKRVEVVYFRGRMPFVMEGIATMREFRLGLLKELDPPPRRNRRSKRRRSRS